MTESADLLAAIAAAPADDLPRLVFADWLDDRGEPAYAQFIRDQIRLAQVPQWDPLAVRARHQLKDSLGIGRPFFGALPELPIFLKWHPEKAFRRGFGSGVVVHQLSGLLEAGPQLFDLAPVEELWLSAATLDEWRQLAKSPWLKNVRKLHFHFSQGLHEPIRCLAESKYARNIDEIWFDTLETPAAGLVIEALAQSPLAVQLKGLHLRLVHTPSLPEVIKALRHFPKVIRLSLVHAGFQIPTIVDLESMNLNDQLQELDLSHNNINDEAMNLLFERPYNILNSINLSFCDIGINLPKVSKNGELKCLFLKRNIMLSTTKEIAKRISRANYANLRILDLSTCNVSYDFVEQFRDTRFWNKLTCLDLSRVGFGMFSKERPCYRQYPENVAALIFDKRDFDEVESKEMESHFGDRLVWAADDAPTGLAR